MVDKVGNEESRECLDHRCLFGFVVQDEGLRQNRLDQLGIGDIFQDVAREADDLQPAVVQFNIRPVTNQLGEFGKLEGVLDSQQAVGILAG